MEWMLVVVSLIPQADQTLPTTPMVTLERFAAQPECEAARKVIQDLMLQAGGPTRNYAIRTTCGQVEALGEKH